MEMTLKLTPALKRWLEFIADGGERGRMVLQLAATGGRASSQLQSLRNADYVEYRDDPDNPTGPDRVRVTEAGKTALAVTRRKQPLTYRRDGDRYIVYLGEDRLGFVRRDSSATTDRVWNAADTFMAWSRWFQTRDAAGRALLRRFLAAADRGDG
jgi:hypothetical protein